VGTGLSYGKVCTKYGKHWTKTWLMCSVQWAGRRDDARQGLNNSRRVAD
jgi:hypothetical protein